MSHSHHSSVSSTHQPAENSVIPPAEGAASKGIRWMREGLGVDFDPEQQLDLDSFARELDRLDRLLAPPPPSSPEVDDVNANAHEEVGSWIGSTGSTEEERRQVKDRILISKMEALEKAKTEVLKLELEVSELKKQFGGVEGSTRSRRDEEDADWEGDDDANEFGGAREGGGRARFVPRAGQKR